VDNSEGVDFACVNENEDTAINTHNAVNRASATRPRQMDNLSREKISPQPVAKNKMKITRARFGRVSNNPFQISLQEKIFKLFFCCFLIFLTP
jgi:hypothetical protein